MFTYARCAVFFSVEIVPPCPVVLLAHFSWPVFVEEHMGLLRGNVFPALFIAMARFVLLDQKGRSPEVSGEEWTVEAETAVWNIANWCE